MRSWQSSNPGGLPGSANVAVSAAVGPTRKLTLSSKDNISRRPGSLSSRYHYPPLLLRKVNNSGLNLQFCFVKSTIHAYACVCMYMHAYACICMPMHAYACICVLMHAYACLCMHIHAYACLWVLHFHRPRLGCMGLSFLSVHVGCRLAFAGIHWIP